MKTTEAASGANGSWRDRVLERSLREARAKAVSRSDAFIAATLDLLAETGRNDFTVQELVERTHTSLRSFYQHFSSKDELLLALCEETVAGAATRWRGEIAGLGALDGLRHLVERIHEHPGLESHTGIDRAISSYHLQLSATLPTDYARVLVPFRELIREAIERGVSDGIVRTDLSAGALATMMMQTLFAAAHTKALRTSASATPIDSDQLWRFCAGGLTGR